MKKVILLTAMFGTILISCTNKSKVDVVPVTPEIPVTESLGEKCYVALANQDTITMTFTVNTSNEVNGKLTYSLNQKDKNEGTIVGTIKGDTLIADYTFMSEGVSSVREVAFLKKDATYIEGYGAILESNGKMVFTDKTKLKFDGKTIFKEVNCTE